jgi:hypothetical protein
MMCQCRSMEPIVRRVRVPSDGVMNFVMQTAGQYFGFQQYSFVWDTT